jgi:tetratricopeptide (TPR) repeat protein
MQPIQATPIADYSTAVNALEHLIQSQPAAPGGSALQTPVLHALRQRDRIDLKTLGADEFETVIHADHKLQALSKAFDLDHHVWADWRELRGPNLEEWWWHLDNLPAGIAGKRSGWDVIAVLGNLAWIWLCLLIVPRIFVGGNEFVGQFFTLITIGLTFLSLNIIPRGIKNIFNTVLDFLGLVPSRHPVRRAFTSVLLACLSFAVLQFGLSFWAARLNNPSRVNNPTNNARTIQDLRFATNLDPSLVEAKVNLALALETAGQNDEAIRLMQEAIQSNDDVRIYRTVARLLTIRAETTGNATDAQTAYALLENAIVRTDCPAVPYSQGSQATPKEVIAFKQHLLFCFRHPRPCCVAPQGATASQR